MPSKTDAQARLMAMCSTPKGRKRANVKCPPMDVAQEFHRVDKHRASKRKRKREHRG